MIIYFEFEHVRYTAEVVLSNIDNNSIEVHLSNTHLTKFFPVDLYFQIGNNKKVQYIVEDAANKRLTELQSVLSSRLQEFVNNP